MAAILASLHMQTADDLFGGPQGSPRSDKLIAASIQWAAKIMEKIDARFSGRKYREDDLKRSELRSVGTSHSRRHPPEGRWELDTAERRHTQLLGS